MHPFTFEVQNLFSVCEIMFKHLTDDLLDIFISADFSQ